MIIKNWYRTPNPFQDIPKTKMTIFDIGSILVMIMLFSHATIIMNVARESILIFIDEHKQQSLSKTLDRKNLGVDATGFFTTRNQTGAQPRENTQVTDANPVSVHSGVPSKGGDESAIANAGDRGEERENIIFRMTYQKLDLNIKRKYSFVFYIVVFFFAFLVMKPNNALRGIWGVAGSIACPLIVCVLPGCFYYYVRKDNEV